MKTLIIKTLMLACFISFVVKTEAQTFKTDTQNQVHLLTIYVIPPSKPLDWTSPCSLYKTTFRSFLSTVTKPNKPFMRHVFIKFSSPLLTETLYAGMTSKNKREQRDYLFKKKIGLGVLGVPLKGLLESPGDLMYYMNYHENQKDLAFITFEIGDHAARDIIDFFHQFSSNFNETYAQKDFYGGVFWPRYEFEGAGCTAFGISMLDIAGIRGDEVNCWKRTINIPNEILGGEYNGNKKVKCRQIKKIESWALENDSTRKYIAFEIYDPQLIYEWVIRQRNLSGALRTPGYLPVEEINIPGLVSDRRTLTIEPDEPLVGPRPDKNIFIGIYHQKLGIETKQSSSLQNSKSR